MPKKPLVLVDGSYYLFRAYHVPQLHQLEGLQAVEPSAPAGDDR